MTPIITIHNENELAEYEEMIRKNLADGKAALLSLLQGGDTLDFYKKVKFGKCIPEPITGRPENFIEVINQSMTYLVCIRGVGFLLKWHPGHEFIVNFGSNPGYDIVSADESIIAECFASTNFRNNRKLTRDMKRLSDNETAQYRYEFFHDEDFDKVNEAYYRKKYPRVQLVQIEIS